MVELTVNQIPIVPEFAETTFKSRGVTCEAIISYILQESRKKITSLYVILSRVRTLKGLFMHEKLTEHDFKYFRPPQNFLEEVLNWIGSIED